jgi:hypothetical protein
MKDLSNFCVDDLRDYNDSVCSFERVERVVNGDSLF